MYDKRHRVGQDHPFVVGFENDFEASDGFANTLGEVEHSHVEFESAQVEESQVNAGDQSQEHVLKGGPRNGFGVGAHIFQESDDDISSLSDLTLFEREEVSKE
jgi:hypothetical protein